MRVRYSGRLVAPTAATRDGTWGRWRRDAPQRLSVLPSGAALLPAIAAPLFPPLVWRTSRPPLRRVADRRQDAYDLLVAADLRRLLPADDARRRDELARFCHESRGLVHGGQTAPDGAKPIPRSSRRPASTSVTRDPHERMVRAYELMGDASSGHLIAPTGGLQRRELRQSGWQSQVVTADESGARLHAFPQVRGHQAGRHYRQR